ncbi:hypothetical protein Dimus_002885 [Dionaea muscipula]
MLVVLFYTTRMPSIMASIDSWVLLIAIAIAIVAATINGVQGGAVVTGSVFCDQCKDGSISLFDYPLYGVKVGMACPGSDGQMTMVGEETTNVFGGYMMRFDGNPNLSSCNAQVLAPDQASTGCTAVAGPAKSLRLMFSMFGMEMYSVDALLPQPVQPMSFCPRSSSTPTLPPPLAFTPVPPLPPVPMAPVVPVLAPPPPPALKLPPLPPMPFFEASACSYRYWMMPEFRCYWKVVNPDMKVALIFGPLAARKYGTDMTLWGGLQGRGDPYRTLLREGTTALLNSYNSFQFPYTAFSVVERLNTALLGSPRTVLFTALRFRRANSGSPQVTCKFRACT